MKVGGTMKQKKRKTYKYVIELRRPMWPRKIVDDLSRTTDVFPVLKSVTDLQNDTHIYGATYRVHHVRST
jgi:hypothetical protein